MATPEIAYNNKTIDLVRKARPDAFQVDMSTPGTVHGSPNGSYEAILASRVSVSVSGEWQFAVGSEGLTESTYLTLRRDLERFKQWARRGELYTLAMDADRTVLTTLALDASKGDATFTVVEGAGITAGRPYVLRQGSKIQVVTILSIAGDPAFTINETLDYDFARGAVVRDLFYWLLHSAGQDLQIADRDFKPNSTEPLERDACRFLFRGIEMTGRIPTLLAYVPGFHTLSGQSGVFTRTDPANYVDSDLVIQSAADAVARESHYPNSNSLRTLHLEDTRTNDFESPDDFNNAAWTKTDTTITSDDIAGPQSGVLADLLTEGTAGTARVTQAETVASGATVAVTFTVKRGNHDWVRIEVFNATDLFRCWVNLSTEALGTQGAAGGGTLTAARIRSLDNGWVAVSLVGSISGATSYSCITASADADASETRVNNATRYQGIAQFEEAAFESSLISGTRNAETAYLPFTPVPQAMTVYVRLVELGTMQLSGGSSSGARFFQIGSATIGSLPRFTLFAATGVNLQLRHETAAGNVTSQTVPGFAIGDVIEARCILFADGAIQLHYTKNGAAEVSVTKSAALALGSAWADTRLYLNSGGTSARGFNAFQAVKCLPGEQPMTICRLAAETA